MIDCIVCQYWSERLYHAKLHSSSGTVSGSEVRRLALCLNDHQAKGACAQRLPALLTDLIEPCKSDQTQDPSVDVHNVILVA
jgi:hypothetical protein